MLLLVKGWVQMVFIHLFSSTLRPCTQTYELISQAGNIDESVKN